MLKDQMEKIYRSLPLYDIPWNNEAPPELLKALIVSGKIEPCNAIDLGCGTGNYAFYLFKHGFNVTGVDFASEAIKKAKELIPGNEVACRFIVADVLGDLSEINGSFDFVYDWDLLHHIFPKNRGKYLDNVSRMLNSGGYYYSVCFSDKSSQFGGVGKYRKTPLNTTLYFSSEDELQILFGKYFQIEFLETVEVIGKTGKHKVIQALMRKK